MNAKTIVLVAFFICFSPALTVLAQEGHPFSGSWVGDWGPGPDQRNRVVVVLEWTGTDLAGTINPGPDAIPIRIATVDPEDWSVHIEADARGADGQTVEYVIDGAIDDLGTYNRSIAGTWNAGSTPGNFSITRQ